MGQLGFLGGIAGDSLEDVSTESWRIDEGEVFWT